jgi:hypothetical protein
MIKQESPTNAPLVGEASRLINKRREKRTSNSNSNFRSWNIDLDILP